MIMFALIIRLYSNRILANIISIIVLSDVTDIVINNEIHNIIKNFSDIHKNQIPNSR